MEEVIRWTKSLLPELQGAGDGTDYDDGWNACLDEIEMKLGEIT